MRKFQKMSLLVLALLLVWPFTTSASNAAEDPIPDGMFEVEATAYYDKYGYGIGADGRPLVEDLTIAGRREWLGCTGFLYDDEYMLIGIYEFRDVGYGQPTGYGKSKLLKGKTIGTIEAGQCVDIYFDSYEKCVEWGRKKVYLQVVRGEG